MLIRILSLIFCILLCSDRGHAKLTSTEKDSKPKKLGDFGDWRAFVSFEKGKKICYMLSFPKSQEGEFKKRGRPYLMITHRPEDQSFNVLSVQAGYKFSKEKKPLLITKVGKNNKEFELFVEGESAWAPTDDLDREIIQHITKTAQSLIFKGQSFKNTKTVDTYSLSGSLAAYKAICEACRLNPEKIL